jgi:hypothetical protein
LAGVTELAKIHAGHGLNVTHNVSHCQTGTTTRRAACVADEGLLATR